LDLRFYEKPVKGDWNTLRRLFWENIELPHLAQRDGVEVLHVPAFAPPYLKGFKLVVTVHDLIGMVFPNQLGWPSRFYWGKWLPFAVRQADAVIADSEHTKKDIMRLLDVPEEKISVIYPSGHETFSALNDPQGIETLKTRWGIREEYFLFVGTAEPRKNLGRVIEAFGRFLDGKRGSRPYQLVVAGSKNFAHGQFVQALRERYGLQADDLVWTGYVTQKELSLLYCGAKALVFPSLYEGFGIPILEAMASGTPVLTSNLTSTPEAAGEAALLVNPYSTEEIFQGMLRLAEDAGLRGELRAKGFSQIKKFSWQKTARETLKVYESLG
jgi:glycosyltransferase involved in cell wall biosynthesis